MKLTSKRNLLRILKWIFFGLFAASLSTSLLNVVVFQELQENGSKRLVRRYRDSTIRLFEIPLNPAARVPEQSLPDEYFYNDEWLVLPLWPLTIATGIPALILAFLDRMTRRATHCYRCGRKLESANAGICPECGVGIAKWVITYSCLSIVGLWALSIYCTFGTEIGKHIEIKVGWGYITVLTFQDNCFRSGVDLFEPNGLDYSVSWYEVLKPGWIEFGRENFNNLKWVHIPLWMPLTFFCLIAAFLFYRDRPRVRHGVCGRCGYDLS